MLRRIIETWIKEESIKIIVKNNSYIFKTPQSAWSKRAWHSRQQNISIAWLFIEASGLKLLYGLQNDPIIKRLGLLRRKEDVRLEE